MARNYAQIMSVPGKCCAVAADVVAAAATAAAAVVGALHRQTERGAYYMFYIRARCERILCLYLRGGRCGAGSGLVLMYLRVDDADNLCKGAGFVRASVRVKWVLTGKLQNRDQSKWVPSPSPWW